jgi:hypothetical protein
MREKQTSETLSQSPLHDLEIARRLNKLPYLHSFEFHFPPFSIWVCFFDLDVCLFVDEDDHGTTRNIFESIVIRNNPIEMLKDLK